jgi:hypothetical protein
MSFLGSNIVFRNTSNRNDFGDVKSLLPIKTKRNAGSNTTKNNGNSADGRKTKKKRRKRSLYFHVHLEDDASCSDNDGNGNDKYAEDCNTHSSSTNSNTNNADEFEDNTLSSSHILQSHHNDDYNGFVAVKKNKNSVHINPKTVYIDRALPRTLKHTLASSCKRMGFALGKPNTSSVWWCSSTRDKSMYRINEMIEKISINKANLRSRVNFFCGMRYSLHKVNLASKIEMYSLLLGKDSFKFVAPTFILPRQKYELEQLMKLQKGKTKKIVVRVKNKYWKAPLDVQKHSTSCDRNNNNNNSIEEEEESSSNVETSDESSYDDDSSSAYETDNSSEADDDSLFDEDGFPVIEQSDESDGETEPDGEYDQSLQYVRDAIAPKTKGSKKRNKKQQHANNNVEASTNLLQSFSINDNAVSEYVEKVIDECDEDVYIVKPSGGKQGAGIILFQGWNGWKKLTSKNNKLKNKILQNCVVQKYISKPFLLQDCVKFDLRLYVFVESLLPMKAYLCTEGLCRFATIPYQRASNRNLHKRRMHLTNYSINRGSSFFAFSETLLNPKSLSDSKGSKRTLSSVLSILEKMGKDSKEVMKDIRRLIGKTCAVLQAELIYIQQRMFSSPASDNHGFHLLGFDIMWDEHLQPYLLEVNAHPSLRTDFQPTSDKEFTLKSPIDEYVKHRVIDGALSILKYADRQRRMLLNSLILAPYFYIPAVQKLTHKDKIQTLHLQ